MLDRCLILPQIVSVDWLDKRDSAIVVWIALRSVKTACDSLHPKTSSRTPESPPGGQ